MAAAAVARLTAAACLVLQTLAQDVDPTCGSAGTSALDFQHVVQNNLGGNGPDKSMGETIQYSHVASVDGGCVMLELSVATGKYSAKDAGQNGVADMDSSLAVVNLASASRVELAARFLECQSRAPAQMSKVNITFYAMNMPTTRQITVRGYWKYYLQNPALFTKAYTEFGTTFIDASPCEAAVGSSDCALSFYFQDTSAISMTLETPGPAQQFFLGASTCKSVHLSSSVCTKDLCDPGYQLRENPPQCFGVCDMQECCERSYKLCSAEVCGFGNTLRDPGELPLICAGEVCTEQECCRPYTADAASTRSAIVAASPAVASCSGHERQWHHCPGLPECHPCVPKDCKMSEWNDWSPMGGCTGLCTRSRQASENNECGKPCQGHTKETVARHDDPFCYPEHCKVKQVDCKWAQWSEWTVCEKSCSSCMKGQSYRERRIDLKALGGGKPCTGSWNMTRPCQLSDALDCKMTEWGGWTECSRTCGTGWKFRMRRVLREAKWGGKPCGKDGDYHEGLAMRQTHACNVHVCSDPEPCMIDHWTDWDGCNERSPYQKYRSRSILMPALGQDGKCDRPLNETQGCPVKKASPPQPCSFEDWDEWTACSASCAGQRQRRRQVSNAEHCVLGKEHAQSLRETAACGDQYCDKDQCEMSDWKDWSECSADCGKGVATRSRHIVVANTHVGCTAGLSEARPCQSEECGKVDCQWGDWDRWSACTCSCGGGTMRRTRMIKVAPLNGGDLCEPGAKAEVAPCNTDSCEKCIDAAWGKWSEWSKCSGTCAPAFRVRHRDLEKHANSCGMPALGFEDDYGLCDGLEPCEVDRDCEVSAFGNWSECSNKCFGMSERLREVKAFASGAGKKCEDMTLKVSRQCNPMIDETVPEGCGPDPQRSCKVGDWEEWSNCTKECGGGQKTRIRRILSPAANNGPPCSDTLAQVVPCGMQDCKNSHCKDCVWGPWNEWGHCTKCGSQRFRNRAIETLPNECGQRCNPGAAKEVGTCKSECEETLFCAWSSWREMGECTATCGHSTRMRQRQLSLSKVDHGQGNFFVAGPNTPCNGNQVDVTDCPYEPCEDACSPQDCVFSAWGKWEDCTCNQLQQRTRKMKDPARCGGEPCKGALVETQRCSKQCLEPVDCQLGDWLEWHPKICGSATDQRVRIRKVTQEPANGGAACAGVINETSACGDSMPEPRDCSLEPWGEWSNCSAECDGGTKSRSRGMRSALHGGAPCGGDLEELDRCNTQPCESVKIDCELSDWQPWSTCDGATMRYRIRRVSRQPRGLGEPCAAALKEAAACSAVVDCEVTSWTDWDDCDKSCGGGQRTRAREVTRNPSSGGKRCPESLVETTGCAEVPCEAEDCTVSDWQGYGDCSVTCGLGFMTRKRTFDARPCEDGRGCDQRLEEVKPCSLQACPCADCKWGGWTEWSHCSAPCDGGQRSRERHILLAPEPGCKPCDAKEKEEIEGCNLHKCHEKVCINGLWDEWEEWESCSASCHGGSTFRTRAVKVEANDCGVPAIGLSVEHKSCNSAVPCVESVACEFGGWSGWSSCSARCAGLKRRHREIKTHGRGAGEHCEGALEENVPCSIAAGVQDWQEESMYLDLTQMDTGLGFDDAGAIMHFRHVAERPALLCDAAEGQECTGSPVDLLVIPKTAYTGCDMEANGVKGHTFGAINVASGSRVTLEFKLVDAQGQEVPAKELGLKIFDLDEGAAGSSRETVHAADFKDVSLGAGTSLQREEELSDLVKFSASRYGTDDDDPDDPMKTTPAQEAKAVAFYYEDVSSAELTFEVSEGFFCKTFLFAVRACLGGSCRADPCKKHKHQAVDCALGGWQAWGQCDATCGVGQHIRSREVIQEPAFGGAACDGPLMQTSRCKVKECDSCQAIDCAWEEWGQWSQCDRCDGQMRRFRHIASHAMCGGRGCSPGDAEEITNCTRSCHERTYCTWATWQPFGACSATCGKGLRSRTRYLKALSEPPLLVGHRLLLGDGGRAADVEPEELDLSLQRKFEQLDLRTQRLRASRLQVLALAAAAGALSVAALAGILSRGACRRAKQEAAPRHNFAQAFLRHSYVQAPSDADFNVMPLRSVREGQVA